jgi:hypothetical protein
VGVLLALSMVSGGFAAGLGAIGAGPISGAAG